MIAYLAQAAADSSWWTIDPDTYRYFFSASAQVFAAIFAVVAIAFSLKIIEIHRSLQNMQNEKRQKAFIYKLYWGYDYLVKSAGKHFTADLLNEMQRNVWILDDNTIDDILESIKAQCDQRIEVENRNENPSEEKIKSVERRKTSVEQIASVELGLIGKKQKAIRNTQISVIIASTMTILALFLLWVKVYQIWFIVLSLIGFGAAIGVIAFLFISLLADVKQPKIKSVQSVQSVL